MYVLPRLISHLKIHKHWKPCVCLFIIFFISFELLLYVAINKGIWKIWNRDAPIDCPGTGISWFSTWSAQSQEHTTQLNESAIWMNRLNEWLNDSLIKTVICCHQLVVWFHINHITLFMHLQFSSVNVYGTFRCNLCFLCSGKMEFVDTDLIWMVTTLQFLIILIQLKQCKNLMWKMTHSTFN